MFVVEENFSIKRHFLQIFFLFKMQTSSFTVFYLLSLKIFFLFYGKILFYKSAATRTQNRHFPPLQCTRANKAKVLSSAHRLMHEIN